MQSDAARGEAWLACSELSCSLLILKHVADLHVYSRVSFFTLSQWSSQPKGLTHVHFKKPVVLLFEW